MNKITVKYFYIFLALASVILISPCFGDTNVLVNPGLETGTTTGWTQLGCNISTVTVPHSGSYGALVSNRTATWQGISQSLLGKLTNGQTYSISGWVKLVNASSNSMGLTVKQVDDSGTKYIPIMWSTGYDNTWTYLSNYFTLNVSGTLTGLNLYFEGPASGVSFYVDDVSVELIDSDWETAANERIEQIRKSDFRITAVSPYGSKTPIADVNIEIHQIRHGFPFGSAINYRISDANYAQFFKNHFEWAVMENESKWYFNEPSEDYVTYTTADSIYNFCSANNITMRGHCIFWAAEGVIQTWIKNLSTDALLLAVQDRLSSAVNHFKNKFVHWDVNNEMCDNSYFADRLGLSIRPWMFQAAQAIDPNCQLFVNDYSVIDGGYNLNDYKQQIYGLLADGAPVKGIGVQCHMKGGFDRNAVKARFDSMAECNLPIWVTEFDVNDVNENIRANDLEDFYRIAFSHPAVKGILMWGFWEDSHWRDDCHIVNSDWTLNEAGRRYEAIRNEWTTNDSSITDNNGSTNFRGFYGKYSITLTPAGAEPTVVIIDVVPGGPNEFTIELTNEPTTCQQVQELGLSLNADLNGDCRVDYEDLFTVSEYWLSSDCPANNNCGGADFQPTDGKVDFLDFSDFSLQWMKCNNPQDSNCIQNW
ncbi:MAG: endo-1,4-beta-xylanase [Phycisphaerae bacterium]|jgi:GH35 family endo-1,4-beta-xylanase